MATTGGVRLTRTARLKMSEFYHDRLWKSVGEAVSVTLMWGDVPGFVYLPYALQHPRLTLGLSNLLQDNLYAKFGDGYPPVVFPSMHVLVESLDLHVITASWDLQFLACLSESTRAKTTAVDVQGMKNGSQASRTGRLFYDTLKCIIRLNNRCHPDMIRDFVNHGTHDSEEYPFLEELHALRRLLATLFAMRNWAETRAQSNLHTWQMRDFLLITQVDAQNIEDCFEILQLATHEQTAAAKSTNIQLYMHVQATLARQIHQVQKSLRARPGLSQAGMSSVCRTLSLATLQNVFPGAKHWRQRPSRALPTEQSPYVIEFIDRVLAPVFTSVEHMSVPIQKAAARIAVKAFCEAWLDHITSSKVKFSDWGAHQISLDFAGLRKWISLNDYIMPDTRRYLLLLDSLRHCEGVAKLLLTAKPEELVDVKPRNKVHPITEETQRPTSPIAQVLESIPVELYVPNHQQWLSLKANSKLLSLPFCCK